jgi:hypothetical protein
MLRNFVALFSLRQSYGAIYLFLLLHPDTGRVVNGYVGKSRDPESRMRWHMATKPWAGAVVHWSLLWDHPRVTNFGLFWREVRAIWWRRPICNYQWNRWNRRRIPIYAQRARFATFGRYAPPRTTGTGYGARRPDSGVASSPLWRRLPGAPRRAYRPQSSRNRRRTR